VTILDEGSRTFTYSPECVEGRCLLGSPHTQVRSEGGSGLSGPQHTALERLLAGLRSCANLGAVLTGRLHQRRRPAEPMVGAKDRFADLRASLAVPRRYAVVFKTTECSMSDYPVHRSLPPTRRSSADEKFVPDSTWPKRVRGDKLQLLQPELVSHQYQG
jgi:hypothetical protein